MHIILISSILFLYKVTYIIMSYGELRNYVRYDILTQYVVAAGQPAGEGVSLV